MREIRSNFLQIFGTTWCMNTDMHLEYCYTDEIYVKISLKEEFDVFSYEADEVYFAGRI